MGRRGKNNLTDENLFFVTTTVVKFTPIFKDTRFCDILISNIKHYQKKYKFVLNVSTFAGVASIHWLPL